MYESNVWIQFNNSAFLTLTITLKAPYFWCRCSDAGQSHLSKKTLTFTQKTILFFFSCEYKDVRLHFTCLLLTSQMPSVWRCTSCLINYFVPGSQLVYFCCIVIQTFLHGGLRRLTQVAIWGTAQTLYNNAVPLNLTLLLANQQHFTNYRFEENGLIQKTYKTDWINKESFV